MIDVARIINDKWDAVWELPAVAFLTLLRYRKAKADYDTARAKQRQNRIA